VTKEYKSIKDTLPDVSLAALFIFAFLGASFEISIPTPPPYEYVLANFLAQSNIDSILSSGGDKT